MPALFVGHGSPMNAIEDNTWSRGFRSLGDRLPRPSAILAISAHWYVPGTAVTANAAPPTIHDFGGFPEPLYEMQYPAPGDPDLAARVARRLGPDRVSLSLEWGLDHGTWSVLCHVRPHADCPVLQLSIDMRLAAAAHVEIGRALAPLRDEGVFIIGSGMSYHNMRGFMNASAQAPSETFDAWLREAATSEPAERDRKLAQWAEAPAARACHPREEHLIPLMVIAGAAGADRGTVPYTGSMGGVKISAVHYG